MSSCKAKHGYMQDRDAQHARGMQEASGRIVRDLEVKTTQLQSQLEQSQQALHAVKAQYGQQETLVQTQQHMDKLQCDLASERQKVTKLTGKSQEVAKAKQDVLLATKALQVRQLQPANSHTFKPNMQGIQGEGSRFSSSNCPSKTPSSDNGQGHRHVTLSSRQQQAPSCFGAALQWQLSRPWTYCLAAMACFHIYCNTSAGQGEADWQTAAEGAAPAECN